MKSPAFQFYPAEFLSDENVALMGNREIGCYMKLMCYCWREGSIPSDISKIARLCGEDSSAMAQLWLSIEPCFSSAINEPSRLVHPRLEKERDKQDIFKKERSESGAKGAKSRWDAARKHDSSAIAKPMAKPIVKHGSSSLSSSSKDITPLQLLLEKGIPEKLAKDWLKIKKAKRMELTETTLQATIREAQKAHLTLEAAITIACEKSWGGFEASFLKDKPINGKTPGANTAMDDQTLVNMARQYGIDTYKQSKNDLVSKINAKLGVN